MIRTVNSMKKQSARKPAALALSLLVWLSLPAVFADSGSGNTTGIEEQMREASTEIEALWGEEACETVYVKKKGYPLASIACSGNYDKSRRAKMLDVLFRHNFVLEKESYKLRPKNGTYLYKTRQGRKSVYFKLYVRDANDLWPRNPVHGKQVAVYVQNLRSHKDLLRWRTLGVPLTYGVTLGRSDTAELLTKLGEYSEETWLAIPLEDDRVEIADGNLLSISDALDAEKLTEYLSVLDGSEGFDGFSPLYCSRFCKNVPALRALLTALREKNAEKETILLDTDASETSSFYQTGRIMNFRTFRAYVTNAEKGNFCSALRSFLALRHESASRILAVDAGDEAAFSCLQQFTRSAAAAPDFVRVSQMSVTNPFR